MHARSMKLLLAAVLVMGTALTVGLSGVAAQSHATVTLSITQVNTGQQATDALIKHFEAANPNINVQATYLPSATLANLIPTQLQSGTASDIIYVTPGGQKIGSVWPLAAAGKLLDLSGQPWFKRMGGKQQQQLSSFQGRVYSWPVAFIPDFVAYNTTLFNQLKLKIPKTFGQMLTMCKTISAAGKVPFAAGFNDTGTWSIISRMLYEQTVFGVNPNWTNDRIAHKTTFAGTPGWHLALQRLVDMKRANCFQAGAAGANRTGVYPIFARGQAVMMMVAASEMPTVLGITPDLKYAYFNPPFAFNPAAQMVAVPASVMLAVNKATKHPAEAKAFINFAARAAQSSYYNKVGLTIAPYDLQRGIVPATMKAVAPLIRSGKYRVGDETYWDSGVYQTGLQPAIQGLITGQANVDGTLATLDKMWDAAPPVNGVPKPPVTKKKK
jgi:raffinose/stachyose/melibiose transport system substrate-binding protein